MWWDYNEELHLKNVRQMGFEEGETNILINQIVKKVKKGQPLEQIADDVEEESETLRPIYEAVVSTAPDFEIDLIWHQLKKQ